MSTLYHNFVTKKLSLYTLHDKLWKFPISDCFNVWTSTHYTACCSLGVKFIVFGKCVVGDIKYTLKMYNFGGIEWNPDCAMARPVIVLIFILFLLKSTYILS